MDGLGVLIPLAGIFTGLVLGYHGIQLEMARVKAKGAGKDAEGLRGVVGDMHGEIQKLRDRVAVLEKLVTDDDRKLADEINRLGRSGQDARS